MIKVNDLYRKRKYIIFALMAILMNRGYGEENNTNNGCPPDRVCMQEEFSEDEDCEIPYTLYFNGSPVTNRLNGCKRGERHFFPLPKLVELIKITGYTDNDDKTVFSEYNFTVDKKNKKLVISGKENSFGSDAFELDGQIYIDIVILKEIFKFDYELDVPNYILSINKENKNEKVVSNKSQSSSNNSNSNNINNSKTVSSQQNISQQEDFSQTKDIPDEAKLKVMRDRGLITQEDYEILLDELNGTKDEDIIYSLNVNGIRTLNGYKMTQKDGKLYFPLFEFLKGIGLTNFQVNEGDVLIKLGDSLKEVSISRKKRNIKTDREIYNFEGNVYEEKGEIFIEAEVFKKIFLTEYMLDERKYIVNMNLNFTAPRDISRRLDITQEELDRENSVGEILYTNKPHLFDLGYARFEFDKTYTKTQEGETEHDWSGVIEYQGDALYGNLTTSYDFYDKSLGNVEIEYPDIWKQHVLRIGSYTAGDDRELGFSFRKDRGYYASDKTYIISERVPIGSRVELIYMGFVLEIQDAQEGVVEFRNPEIRSDRTYELKIYSPDGKIEIRTIKTAEDYNQQNKNEVEYDISGREDSSSGKYSTDINVFYGVTDNLTVGGTYTREPDTIGDDVKYVNTGRGEIVYSNYFKTYPYVLRVGGEKTLNSYSDGDKDLSDRYKHDYLAQFTVNNWKFIVQRENYGEYYDEKSTDSYEIEYDFMNWATITYEYEKSKMYSGETETDSSISVSASKSFKSLMATIDYRREDNGDNEYGINFYYNGFDRFSTRWENRWTETNGESSYETAFTVYSNSYRGSMDYSISAGYSDKYKDKFTLSFTLRLDDWFKFTGDWDKEGNQNYTAGIDKVVDLQNVTKKVTSMDVSRVKVITFVDKNNNNIYDKGEEKIPDVEVSIGDEYVVTDEKGEGMFYGVPNSIVYDLKPKIKKPSFTLGNNKIKIKGRTSSTIEAYIPVKPMVNLSGKVMFDEILKLSEQERQEVYSEILIRILDSEGNEIELTMPDNTGEFDVSGLFPEEYRIEVMYMGSKYKISNLKERISLIYDDGDTTSVVFRMTDKAISMDTIHINKDKDEVLSLNQ